MASEAKVTKDTKDEVIESLQKRLDELETQVRAGNTMPTTMSPEKNVAKALEELSVAGAFAAGTFKTFGSPTSGLQQGDIVAIKSGSFKDRKWRDKAVSISAEQPILGQVTQYLGVVKRRDENGNITPEDVNSYKVAWMEGIGKDGNTEDELVFVQRPVQYGR